MSGLSLFAMWILGLFLVLLALHTFLRVIKHFYHFPIPGFMTKLIDNPVRRRFNKSRKSWRSGCA